MKKTIVNSLLALILLVSLISSCTAAPSTPAAEPAPFSYVIPKSQDMSAETLGELADIVQGYVEEGRIVGAELMVLKNRYIVLHEVFGLKSQEDETPMEKNTLFNIRSMTKPITGSAV